MVDRVYKKQIPALRKALERLREDFSNLSPKTDWTGLRIEPLLKHAESLERLLGSREFSREFSRLTKGVVFFRSDLEYLRTNVKRLEKLLQSESESLGRRDKKRRD
jgi:predicted RNase H-like nuclease (RuvC/YqgF family)